jgi:magnesium transporter
MTDKKTSSQDTIIHELSFKPKKRIELFLGLSIAEQAELIHILSKGVRKNVLNNLGDDGLMQLLEKVDPDDATDLLQLISSKRRGHIMEQLNQNLKDTLGKLLEFDPDTAAGLMTLDYIQVEPASTLSDIAEKVKLHEDRTGRAPVVVVVNNGRLAGVLPAHALAFGRPSERIEKLVRHSPTVRHSAIFKEVIELF